MAKGKDRYAQLDSVATQLNRLAESPGRYRPSAISIAALVGLALTLAIGTRNSRQATRQGRTGALPGKLPVK